jgi:ribose transport system permease protein
MSPCFNSSNRPGLLERGRIYAVLLGLCLVFSLLSPLFAGWQNAINILLSSATIGLLTIGAAFVIGSAGLDLSVGSVLAFSGAGASVAANSGLPWPLVVLVCILSGTGAGCINGVIIARGELPAFIVTLGMLSVARGAALILTDGRPIYGLPDPIVFIGQGTILGLPVPVWIFILTGICMHLVLRRTAFGSRTLCIGDNEKAAFTAGVDVKSHKIKLYMLSGFLAALAGLVFMGRVNAADPGAGVMYELAAITGAILGGTHIFGGRASVSGAMVGALIMGVLQNGLTLLAVPSYYQQLAIGIVLVLAVSLDRLTAEDSKC